MTTPLIGIALGSGAARGLSHISYIEAFDELGLQPATIAGTSIGALIGAGWASGMSGREMREHAYATLGTMQLIAGRLWTKRPTFRGVMEAGVSLQVDPIIITNAFLPDSFADDFSALRVPFRAVATDLHSWESTTFRSGPLRHAIAASMAIPAIFRPVQFAGRTYIDGGVTNPLPLDLAAEATDILIGVDVNGAPSDDLPESPGMIDVGFTATRIMTRALTRAASALHPPHVLAQAPSGGVAMLEFWRVRDVLAAADAVKDDFKRSVSNAVDAWQRRTRAG